MSGCVFPSVRQTTRVWSDPDPNVCGFLLETIRSVGSTTRAALVADVSLFTGKRTVVKALDALIARGEISAGEDGRVALAPQDQAEAAIEDDNPKP